MQINKRNDRSPDSLVPADTLNMSHALGSWINTNSNTGEVSRLEISSCDGAILVRAFGATPSGDRDLGQTQATAFTSSLDSADLTGLTAAFDFEWSQLRFVINIKLGVLVLQSYSSFQDESGRRPYYKREFFWRPDPPEDQPAGALDDAYLVGIKQAPAVRVDLSPLLGLWENTNDRTRWVRSLTLSENEAGYQVAATDADGAGWEPVSVTAYQGNTGELAFRAEFRTDEFVSEWSVNVPHGLVVIAGFHEVRSGEDAGRYFWREFFGHRGNEYT